MLHEILFNATIPGAYMNAVQVAKERDRQQNMHRPDAGGLKKSIGLRTSRREAVWAKLVSLFNSPGQDGAGQTPAE